MPYVSPEDVVGCPNCNSTRLTVYFEGYDGADVELRRGRLHISRDGDSTEDNERYECYECGRSYDEDEWLRSVKTCPCGAHNDEDADECSSCGENLSEDEPVKCVVTLRDGAGDPQELECEVVEDNGRFGKGRLETGDYVDLYRLNGDWTAVQNTTRENL